LEKIKSAVVGRVVPGWRNRDRAIGDCGHPNWLMRQKEYRTGVGWPFVVDPDGYEEMRAEVEAKVTEYKKHIENTIRGMEGEN
jgi:hypothetical protein